MQFSSFLSKIVESSVPLHIAAKDSQTAVPDRNFSSLFIPSVISSIDAA